MCLTLVVCIIDFVMNFFLCERVVVSFFVWQVSDYHNKYKKCSFWHKFYSVMHKLSLHIFFYRHSRLLIFGTCVIMLVILWFNLKFSSSDCTRTLLMFIFLLLQLLLQWKLTLFFVKVQLSNNFFFAFSIANCCLVTWCTNLEISEGIWRVEKLLKYS